MEDQTAPPVVDAVPLRLAGPTTRCVTTRPAAERTEGSPRGRGPSAKHWLWWQQAGAAIAAARQGLAEDRAVLPGLREGVVVFEQLAEHTGNF